MNLIGVLVFGLVITLFVPFLVYNNSKKIFRTNKYLQEPVLWTITESRIKLKGLTFETEYEWSNIYQIVKLKNWTLIYKDTIVCNIIPNRSFLSTSDYEKFWELVKANQVKIK